MIELKNITKQYGNLKAVNDISFEIDQGEIVGLLGPNGAGKSTTMKIIAGFLLPDTGEVEIASKNLLHNLVESRLKIGYMPENNPLYTDMLVKDSLKYALSLHLVPKKDQKDRLEYVVKAVGLESVYYKPINQLSKGFKQRVGLAQAIIHDPKILILDEPTEGLDPNQRQEIRKLIRELGKDKTIIISTHVMQEVEAMCTRLIVINAGKIVLDGDKNKIIKKELGTGWVNVKVGGKGVNERIKELRIKELEIIENSNNLLEFRVKPKEQDKFYKDFSNLAVEYKWVIYNLSTEKRNLEDLFAKLTKKNPKDDKEETESKSEKEEDEKKTKRKVKLKI